MIFWRNCEHFFDMWGRFGVYVRPEICFEVYSNILITFIFIDFLFSGSFIFAFLGSFGAFYGSYRAVFGLGSDLKTFLGFIHIDY